MSGNSILHTFGRALASGAWFSPEVATSVGRGMQQGLARRQQAMAEQYKPMEMAIDASNAASRQTQAEVAKWKSSPKFMDEQNVRALGRNVVGPGDFAAAGRLAQNPKAITDPNLGKVSREEQAERKFFMQSGVERAREPDRRRKAKLFLTGLVLKHSGVVDINTAAPEQVKKAMMEVDAMMDNPQELQQFLQSYKGTFSGAQTPQAGAKQQLMDQMIQQGKSTEEIRRALIQAGYGTE